jgi:hypothetical protein
MMKNISAAGIFVAAILMCVPAAHSQQSTSDQGAGTPVAPEQPLAPGTTTSSGNGAPAVPAGRSALGGGGTDESQDSAQSEALPLSGAQQVGIPGAQARNVFDAAALFSGSGDSGVINAQGAPTWGANELVGGELSLTRTWKADSFSLSYFGGGEFFQPTALFPDSMFHTLSVDQQFGWKRLTLRLLDSFTYSPNTPFGGAGIGGPGLLAETGVGSGTINPTFGSNDTILTGQSRILNNSAIGEIQYNVSLRSSFTVTGSDLILDYVGGGFIDSNAYVASAGYNYAINPKDTLAATYALTEISYTGIAGSLTLQQANLAYAHQLTSRFVFQISAGPEFIEFHNYTPSVANVVSWNLSTKVQYRLRRTSFDAYYSRGANAGSGVFAGSTTQNVGGVASHQFSRFLFGALNAGYSFNGNLTTVPGVSNQYQNWFVGASVGRQLGRRAHISFNYGALQQPSNGICPVASCGTNHLVQTMGVALDFHLRAIDNGE